jgi:hypothetical protein
MSVEVEEDGAGAEVLELGATRGEELHKPRATPRGPQGSEGTGVGAICAEPGGGAELEDGVKELAGEDTGVVQSPRSWPTGPQGSTDVEDDGVGADDDEGWSDSELEVGGWVVLEGELAEGDDDRVNNWGTFECGCDDDWAEEEGGDVDGADDDVVGPLNISREIKEGAELLGSEDDKGGNIQWPSRSKPKGQVTVEDAGVDEGERGGEDWELVGGGEVIERGGLEEEEGGLLVDGRSLEEGGAVVVWEGMSVVGFVEAGWSAEEGGESVEVPPGPVWSCD